MLLPEAIHDTTRGLNAAIMRSGKQSADAQKTAPVSMCTAVQFVGILKKTKTKQKESSAACVDARGPYIWHFTEHSDLANLGQEKACLPVFHGVQCLLISDTLGSAQVAFTTPGQSATELAITHVALRNYEEKYGADEVSVLRPPEEVTSVFSSNGSLKGKRLEGMPFEDRKNGGGNAAPNNERIVPAGLPRDTRPAMPPSFASADTAFKAPPSMPPRHSRPQADSARGSGVFRAEVDGARGSGMFRGRLGAATERE